MLNIDELKWRKEPTKHTEMLIEDSNCNTVKSKKKKMYDYYICDYCGDKIRLDVKKDKRTGGTAIIPHSLTKCGQIKLALCNKCLNKTIKEFERGVNK